MAGRRLDRVSAPPPILFLEGGSTVGGYRKTLVRRPIQPRLYLDAGRTRGLTTHKNNVNRSMDRGDLSLGAR